jgi:PPOX class F420-dependent enzyme/OxyR family protein
MPVDEIYARYLNGHSRGRLATVGTDGSPQNKPVGYRYNADLGAIDIAGFEMERSAKYRNIGVNPRVALVVDDQFGEGAAGTRYLEVRGYADQIRAAGPVEPGMSPHLIRIRPRRLVAWNIDLAHPGLHTTDLTADSGAVAPAARRPALGLGGATARAAEDAAASVVAGLQAGWDSHDADVTDRRLSADVIWGSPFGATVRGYEQLHAIHARLKRQGTGGPLSRFEVMNVLAVSPDVAVAQVRRNALGPDGQPLPPGGGLTGPFSEMALYVLVRRGTTWWLAAGQNTPILPPPPA